MNGTGCLSSKNGTLILKSLCYLNKSNKINSNLRIIIVNNNGLRQFP